MASSWSDSPITSAAEDLFGRSGYAAHAARLIDRGHSWDDSVVYGLTGPWGSGKSSMLAMVAEEIQSSSESWRVARFTPWATGDVSGLLGEFYASLGSVLPPQRGDKIRSALARLAHLTAPVAEVVPLAGTALGRAAEMTSEALSRREPWDEVFREASEQLRDLGTPVLVVADDIDRLQRPELNAFLRVIRLLGRFPGVDYLIAYDETTLGELLEDQRDDASRPRASSFMEKIVQYPLAVPPLLPTQLLRYLETSLDAVLAESDRPSMQSRRLGSVIDSIRLLLSTPRAVDRFIAQLRHHLPMVPPSEINDEDVILLTLLRTSFPGLYGLLPRWRKELISGHTDEMKPGRGSIEYEPFDVDELLNSVDSRRRPAARDVLIELFPNLGGQGSRSVTRYAGRRVCDDSYFDRYFAMAVPDYDIENAVVEQAFAKARAGHGTDLTELLLEQDPIRITHVFDKAIEISGVARHHYEPTSDLSDDERLRLIASLGQIVSGVVSDPSRLSDPQDRCLRWMGAIAAGLTSGTSAGAVQEALRATVSLADQIAVLHHAMRAASEARPSWLPSVSEQFAREAAEVFLANLRDQDQASLLDRVGWVTYFVRAAGLTAEVRDSIDEGLRAGDFGMGDVAARFVTTPQTLGTGAGPHLGDPDQEAFDELVPAGDDPWFDLSTVEVDVYDLSWSNRKAFAAGRLRRPRLERTEDGAAG